MNSYLAMQIRNMIFSLDAFEQSCKMSALQDDGKVSHEEEKILKEIASATKEYKDKLNKIAK